MRIKVAVLAFALLAPTLARAQGFIRYWSSGGGGGGAPTDAQYVTAAADGTLSAERVCADTATIDCDAGTAAQMKFNLISSPLAVPLVGAAGCGATLPFAFTGNVGGGICSTAPDTVFLRANAAAGAGYLQLTDAFALFGELTTTYFGTAERDPIAITNVAAGAGSFIGSITSADLTAARTWTHPDVSGTYQLNLALGSAAPGATECDAANEVGRLYHQTGDPASVNLQLWRCTQTGAASYAWHPVSHQVGTAAPATCTVGAVFFDSDATAGLNWFGCTAANTWSALGTTVAAGSGITTTGTGPVTVAVDRAVVPFKGSGTADPPATCGDTGDDYQLHDTYLETDTSEISICIAVDTWALIGHVADDKVIVGTGTGAIVETIPACTDTGGNHLNYDAAGTPGSRFSCGTSGGAAGSVNTILASGFGPAENITLSATRFFGPWGSSNEDATETNRSAPIAEACTLSSLYVRTQDAQPGTGSLVIALSKNGTPTAITLTVAAGAAAGTYSNTTNTATVAAGDLISMKVVNNATSASAFMNGWSYKCQGTAAVLAASYGGANQYTASTTTFSAAWGSSLENATETNRSVPISQNCTIGNLYVRTQDAQSANGSLVFTVSVNATPSTVVATVGAGAAAGTYSNTTNTIAVSTGDLIAMKVVNNANVDSAFVNGWSMTCQ